MAAGPCEESELVMVAFGLVPIAMKSPSVLSSISLSDQLGSASGAQTRSPCRPRNTGPPETDARQSALPSGLRLQSRSEPRVRVFRAVPVAAWVIGHAGSRAAHSLRPDRDPA